MLSRLLPDNVRRFGSSVNSPNVVQFDSLRHCLRSGSRILPGEVTDFSGGLGLGYCGVKGNRRAEARFLI
jgi:hypothetical protein